MRLALLAALVLVAVSSGAAGAQWVDAPDWYHRLAAAARSLIGASPPDHEVIPPPGNIDPKMVLTPPLPSGRMPVIVPPEGRQR